MVAEMTAEAIFAGHTAHGWADRPVPQAMLERLVAMAGMGPTAFNQQPLRVIFVTTAEGKARLEPALSRGNRDKTMAAPVTAILCSDLGFWRDLPQVWPQADVRGYFDGKPDAARDSARRNATLQAGYLILAARALGLGAGPMSGFDAGRVAGEFLPGDSGDRMAGWEVNFLLNIGWPDPAANRPRLPRHGFGHVARIV
jgi:3-hydroxypropanoate dehydrogenase